MITSKRFTLNAQDFIRGLLFAVGTGAVDALLDAFTSPPINWQNVGIAAAAAGLLYIKVKFLSSSKKVTKNV